MDGVPGRYAVSRLLTWPRSGDAHPAVGSGLLGKADKVFKVNKSPDRNELLKFGWSMLAGFGVIGMVLWVSLWWKGQSDSPVSWSGGGAQVTAVCLWALGVLLWALSMLTRSPARVVYVAWMSAAMTIGRVMSTVLLTVLFIALLPIFSLVVRIGDPLRRRSSSKDTYWEDYKPHEATMERMRRPF